LAGKDGDIMAELIQREDSLNTGREKLNEAIKASDRAEGKSDYAVDTAETALSNSESTQIQLDTIVIEGDSSVEAAQARVDAEGNTYNTLKERLDEKESGFSSQLAETMIEVDSLDIYKADKDYVENFENSTGASLATIIAKYELEPMPDPITKENLWDTDAIELGNLSTTTGNVIDSSSVYVNDFQAVQENTPYTYSVGELYQATNFVWKVCYYDENQNFIEGYEYGYTEPNTHATHITPSGTKFIRVSMNRSAVDTFAIVVGEEPYNQEDEGVIYDGGFWEDVPTPPLKNRSVNSLHLKERSVKEEHLSPVLRHKIDRQINNRKYPNPPRLNFEVIGNTTGDTPRWLSEDGEVLYITSYYDLKQTTDEWETVQNIGDSFVEQVRGIRVLSDGQLLVSTGRDESVGKKAEVWKSENYDRNSPETTTFKKVFEAEGEAAEFYNDWGMDVYGELVLLCEYGTKTGTGARRVYLSKDHGESFERIFFQEEEHLKAGIEYDEGNAHTHTAAYDPWFNRIWVCCGDGVNTSTWYSDDLGLSWNLVEGSNGINAVQYTGIIALKDGVVFGSDRPQNGLHIARRTRSRLDKQIIEPFEIINDLDVTSHIFQMPFRKKIGDPVYFGSAWDLRAGDGYSVVMGFVDGSGADIVYEFPTLITEAHGNTGIRQVIGATSGGYVYTAFYDSTTSTWSQMRALAPTWE